MMGLFDSFSSDIGIDLGTASVLVYVKGKGIVLREPSIVAIDTRTNCIIKVGREALNMQGRTPGYIKTVRPLKSGVISQYDVTLKMLQHFIRKACGNMIFKPRVMICVPTGISEVEERAVLDAAMEAGAKQTRLIEEPIAAAMGAGLDIYEPKGNMIIDIGGGTTDIAVISLGGVVVSESIKTAGDKFDEAIVEYARRRHHLLIGDTSAEQVKIRIGCLDDRMPKKSIDIKGRCLKTNMPRVITLSSTEMIEALMDPISEVLDAVRLVIERTPPELVGDIMKNGIVMTGGGSRIPGFAKMIHDVTGIKTRVAEDAVSCVVKGTGMALENPEGRPTGMLKLAEERKNRL
jgi:rod shape-determining protein MreB